jgi:hypothetical protein
MLNALMNVRFWGKADIDQPLLINLDLYNRPAKFFDHRFLLR